jgi:DNA repair protein RadC
MADEPHHGIGHRERLRARLLNGGPDALHDHELVEYLLGLAIPRRDTKPLAKRLIEHFGGFGGLVAADPEVIRRVGGISEAAVATIKIAQASALRLVKTQTDARHVLGSWQALLDYLHAHMAHKEIEQVRVLYLNSKNRLLRDETVSEGSIDEAAVYVREIMRKALDYKATALILVHNHPSGDPQPSQQDIRLTRDVIEAGRHLKVTVHDHVIIGSTGHASMRAMGLI